MKVPAVFIALLLALCASVQAQTVNIQPQFFYGGVQKFDPPTPYETSLSQAEADVVAHDSCNSSFCTLWTNFRPDYSFGDPYSWVFNGTVNDATWFDEQLCPTLVPNQPGCSTGTEQGYIAIAYPCPVGFEQTETFGSGSHPTPVTVWCYPNHAYTPAPPPPVHCQSCLGNPIYASAGLKLQTETDYQGPTGLDFVRTYRSNPGRTFSITSATFTDYSGPPGTLLSGCYPTYYTVPGTSTNVGTCLPYIAVGQNQYQLTTADGRFIQFSGPTTAVTQNADINDRVTQIVVGGVTQWQVKRDDDSVELYTAGGALITKTLRGGKVITYTYSTNSTPSNIAPGPGYLIGQSDPFGHALSWTYNAAGQMVQMTDPAGATYQYGYDAQGNLTGVTYPDTTGKTYWYNESANTGGANLPMALTGITDENNVRYATFQYADSGSPFGLATNTQHAGGVESYTVAYSGGSFGGAITSASVTDPLGANRNYNFSQNLSYNYDTSQTQPAASGSGTVTTSETYDANNNPATLTDYNGNQTSYVYDLSRNLETSRVEGLTSTGGTTAQTRTITTTWDPNWRQPQVISIYAGATASGTPLRITTFTYDGDSGVSCGNGGAGALCSKTVTDTSVTPNVTRKWSYTYDTYGRMLTAKGPRTDVNSTTTYTYYTCTTGYQCGMLKTVTDPVGNVTTYNTYNAHGQPLTITDPNGVVTTLTYDARLRLKSRQVGTDLTSFTYYPTGLLEQVTLPDGSDVVYTYDPAHRLTKINDGAGNYIQYSLDNMGNRTQEQTFDPSNALHRTHTRVFNALNQLYQDVNAANTAAVTTTYGYDNNGNQTSISAPLARNTTNYYDPLNRLSQILDPGSGNTYFGYDANDNLTSVKDPKTLTTSYTYNGFGDLSTVVSPDTGTKTNTYDSGGNLATATDARNTVGTYSYDAANRVTKIVYSKGKTIDQTLTFGYDAGTYGKGRLTSASDANHSMSWTYDFAGRVTGKGLVIGTVFNKSVGYGYTNADMTSLITPSGQAVTYGFNSNHQVTSVKVNGTTVISSVSYEPFGGVDGWTWGNGTTVSRTYNGDGLVSQIVTAGVTLAYTFDNANRIQGISDSSNSALTWTYGYDLLDRLNSATTSAINDGWTYDANGNRLKQTGTTAITFTVAAASNRITKTTGGLVRTYTYDAAGDVTSNGTSFVYNDRGRMASTSASNTVYLYNALGQMIEKSGTLGTTVLMQDEAGHLMGEYSSTGSLIEETIWLGDIPVATLQPNGSGGVSIFYVHTDHLNTPRKVSRPSDNALEWRWDADPFGTTAANSNPAGLGTFTYNLRFPGQYYMAETGLNQNYFRDYDPLVGRYVESDPIGLNGGGYSTYNYVVGNPTSLVDPTGLDPLGQGYTSRVDPFNYGGESSFEMHVFDPEGNEVGVYGPKGWIAKHGRSGRPANLPSEVENACKTYAEDRLKNLKVPLKGELRLRYGRWTRFLIWLPLIDWYQQETQPSIDQACQLDPNFEGC